MTSESQRHTVKDRAVKAVRLSGMLAKSMNQGVQLHSHEFSAVTHFLDDLEQFLKVVSELPRL